MLQVAGGVDDLRALSQLLVDANVPSVVADLLGGASLTPLAKPDGGVRPLAVGEALSPFPRETYVLATKLFWPLSDHPFPTANDRGLSRKQIFNECHKSLKRLQTDHIDLYQCHRYDELTPLDEAALVLL